MCYVASQLHVYHHETDRAHQNSGLVGSDQARFKFAKDAIEVRKKAGVSRGAGAEETVVLAFGGGNGTAGASAVHITRKLRKKPLWKINA